MEENVLLLLTQHAVKESSALPTMNDLRREVVRMSWDMTIIKSRTESTEVDWAAMK